MRERAGGLEEAQSGVYVRRAAVRLTLDSHCRQRQRDQEAAQHRRGVREGGQGSSDVRAVKMSRDGRAVKWNSGAQRGSEEVRL